MSNLLYITSRDYISPDRLIIHLRKMIGIEPEIIEYNSNYNCTTDYVIKFKENIAEKNGQCVFIQYPELPVYLYSNNREFTRPSMLLAKHHYNLITGNQYTQYDITKPVYKYENYKFVETEETPFLFL